MKILTVIRLGEQISTGEVYKIWLEPTEEQLEHAIHILINGSIKSHTHTDDEGLTEGYRTINLETGEFSPWKVVGKGMPEKSHEIPFKEGIQLVEGIKKPGGIECWPELQD